MLSECVFTGTSNINQGCCKKHRFGPELALGDGDLERTDLVGK